MRFLLLLCVVGAVQVRRGLRRDVARRGLGACGAALALAARAAGDGSVDFTLKGDRLGLELADDRGRVQVRRVVEGTEAFALGITPLSYVVKIDGAPVGPAATAASVGDRLRRARRPVTLSLDVTSAFRGLGVGEAFERMAEAQGNPTARLTVEEVFPSPQPSCMRTRDGDLAEIDYVGTLANGAVFDERKRFAATLGNGELVKGLELGAYEMCIGERRLLKVPPALGFGRRGSKVFNVPPDATLFYDVALRGINLRYDPATERDPPE